MNRRGTGAVFCFIAAMLFASRYIAAAIFMSSVNSWNTELFRSALHYVGPGLSILSIMSLVVGVGYLLWGEISEKKKRNSQGDDTEKV